MTASLRILLVDDNELVRQSIRSLLANYPGLTICGEAADGIEAVEKAKQLRPDAVLMDVTMPRMDGLQAARALRRDLPDTKVILISQNDPGVMHQQVAEVDAHGYVGKIDLSRALIPTLESLFHGRAAPHPAGAPSAPASAEVSSSWLAGGGEMGKRIRSFDWSKTVLGPTDRWPESLKTAVSICIGSRNPIVLWWGRSTLLQFYNDAFISFLGSKKHPAFLGRSGRECWSEIWETMGPMWEHVFATGEATWSEDFLYVLNRNLPLEECYFTFSYSPLRKDAEAIDGIFCACYETTGRVVGDRRLRTLRDLGRTVATAKTAGEACKLAASVLSGNPADLPFALLYLLDDNAQSAHLAAITGLEGPSEAAPARMDLTPSADLAWPLRRVLDTGSPETVTDLPRRFGRLPGGLWPESPETALVVPIASTGQPGPAGFLIAGLSPRRTVDADYRAFVDLIAGHVSTTIANARAYEEERKRAEALAEIDRAKTAFFSNVSHEFRTPLTLMLGPLADLLARSQTHLSATAKEQLELVNRNGARLLRLVNTLLDFSRIEAVRVEAVYQATDLSVFTSELASVFRSATDRAGLRLIVDCENLGQPVYVDRDMWEKIVLNLLSNAFKFTFEGEIAVRLRGTGAFAELHVRDTGVGIPAEEMPRLFERFHRIANVRSRTYEGSGIGLALVQELVKLHGGGLRVESDVGQGSTFIVTVPFGRDHLASAQIGGPRALSSTAVGAKPFVEEALRWLPDAAPSSEDLPLPDELLPVPGPPLPGAAVRPRIIVADDNSDMRQYLVRLFRERYEVEGVADGRAALAASRERPPDLILSDVMMPLLDGLGLLRELRADSRLKEVPIVLLSARAGEESRSEGMEAGADDYLVKPFSSRELMARVEAHVKMYRMRQQARVNLEAEVLIRTGELRKRNVEVIRQSELLREFSQRLLQAQDEERRRIARELHDSSGQILTALAINLGKLLERSRNQGLAKDVEESLDLVRQLSQEIRTTSYLLHPPLLDETGVAGALQWYVEGFNARSGIDMGLEIDKDFGRFSSEIELAIFRIVQEALTNIHRHSGSRKGLIRLSCGGTEIALEIQDYGKGMSAEKLEEVRLGGAGVGLRGMRERVRQLHGEMEVRSSAAGTILLVTFPAIALRAAVQPAFQQARGIAN